MCRCLRRSDSNDMICSFRSFTLLSPLHDYVAVAQEVEAILLKYLSWTSVQIVEEHENSSQNGLVYEKYEWQFHTQ